MINRLSRREGVAVRGTLSIYVGGRRSFAIGQMENSAGRCPTIISVLAARE